MSRAGRRQGERGRARHVKLVTVAGREIGIFNIGGEFFALANRCPHAGGPLCERHDRRPRAVRRPGQYRLSRAGGIRALSVARLGIRHPHRPVLVRPEFRQGAARFRSRSSRARVSLKGPYVAETFPVAVEEDYLVIEH